MQRIDIKADAQRAIDIVTSGGIVLFPHDCGYGIVGGTEETTNTIFNTKQRGGHKRNTLVCDLETQRELHNVDQRTQDMIETIAFEHDLPIAAIAPYNPDHPFIKNLSPELLKGSTALGRINLFLNAGNFANELAARARDVDQILIASSANLTGTGQKFRLMDVQEEVRSIADLHIDYGLRKYHTYKRSATIINFATMEVVRMGACYEVIADILKRQFDVDIPADPGLKENPSGHLQEFALKDIVE